MKAFGRGSIFFRLIIIALLPAVLLGITLLSYFTHSRLQALELEMRATGQLIANQLAPAAQYGISVGSNSLLQALINSSFHNAHIQRIEILDAHGKSLAIREKPRTPKAQLQVFSADIWSPHTALPYDLFLRQIHPDLNQAAELLGSVKVSLNTQLLTERQRSIVLRSLLLGGVVLLIVILLAIHLSRSLAKPLAQMRNAIQALQDGYLHTRLRVYKNDQIGQLMSNINRLAVALEQAEQQQQSAMAELDRARRHAEQANHAKSDFLAMMSHELRTPLNGVMGMLQLLETTSLSSEQTEYIHVAAESTEHLLKVLNDILDVSRIERGALEFESIAFDLQALLSNAVKAFDYAATQKGLQLMLETRGEPSNPQVIGDPTRLRQILVNLLGNALKFTEQGIIRLFAHWALHAQTLELVIEVSDTGIGMEPENLERMFEQFQQGDSSTSRRFGGTGLGLSIARQFARRMGGDLVATTWPGAGSCFTLTIPLTLAEAPFKEPPESLPTGVTRPALQPVLLVEDNPVNQLVIGGILRSLSQPVVIADSGQQALQLLQNPEQPYSIILMDIQLPDLDGFETYRQYIQRCLAEQHEPLPCIALTASAADVDRIKSEAAGMQGFLSKPVTRRTLQAALEQWSKPIYQVDC